MTLNKRLAANLKALRKERDLTQQALAERAGIEYKYYQRIEGGEPLNLTLATLDRLARALKADVADLFRRH